MKSLLQYLKKYISPAVWGPVFVLFSVVAETLQPKVMSKIIDIGVPSGDVSYIVVQGLIMVGLAIVALAAGYGNMRCSSKAAVGFGTELRYALFEKVQSFSFSNIDKFSTASIITRLTSDVMSIQQTLMMMLRLCVRAPSMLIIAGFFALSINAELAGILLVALPVLIVASALIIRAATPLFLGMQKKIDSLNQTLQENFIGIRVVKSFVREDRERKKFERSNEDLREASLKAFNIVIMIMPGMMLVMNLTILAVIWLGGQQVAQKLMGTGELISFITYITQILISLVMFSMALMMLSRARASVTRVTEILQTEPTIKDAEGTLLTTVPNGAVEFHDVDFKYKEDGNEYVLKDITFSIPSGGKLAIMGATGTGKTTLVQLMPRLYEASQGKVKIGGHTVQEYTMEALRASVAMVLQKNVLFSGTIKENLRWGKEDATDAELEAACRVAQADEFIKSFPEGYDTVLEQGGVNLSGGQRQRLCIARALLMQPKVLVLDDSTSAVDTATEAAIRQAFETDFPGMTQVIIAQRVSSVKHADVILIMDDGRIVGSGTHEQLLQSSEIYREICTSQEQRGVA